MSKNNLKNNLERLRIFASLVKDPSRKVKAQEVISMYKNRQIPNIKTAENLIDKLSSRGKGPERALENLKKLQAPFKKLQDDKSNIVAQSFLDSMPVNVNPTQKQKLTSEERKAVNKRQVEDVKYKRKYDKNFVNEVIALNGSIREITMDNVTGEFSSEDLETSTLTNVINYEAIASAVMAQGMKFVGQNNQYNHVINLIITFVMQNGNDDQTEKGYFHSKVGVKIQSANHLKEWVWTQMDAFHVRIDEFTEGGSGWTFKDIDNIKIQIGRSKKTRAGSYIPLPSHIESKRACVNVKNNDDRCIVWALLSYLHADDTKVLNHRNKVSSYRPFLNEVVIPSVGDEFECDEDKIAVGELETNPDQKGDCEVKVPSKELISFPIDIQSDVKKFERLNNIKINIYEEDRDINNNGSFKVVYNNMSRNDRVCNMLLLTDPETGREHLVWIKSLHKLLRKDSNHKKRHWCSQCLSASYENLEDLTKHQIICFQHEAVAVRLPDVKKPEECMVTFKNVGNSFIHPFTCTLDFESTLQQYVKDDNDKEFIKESAYQTHKINSCGLKYNCQYNEFSLPVKIINNPDPEVVIKKTIERLEKYAKLSYKLSQKNKFFDQHGKNAWSSDPNLKALEKIECFKSWKCKECSCDLYTQSQISQEGDESEKKSQLRVIHHDHITGKFLGVLCSGCNLRFKLKPMMTVNIHNLKGYDAHFLIPKLSTYGCQQGEITCIPNNEEKYISFSKKIVVDGRIVPLIDKKTKKPRMSKDGEPLMKDKQVYFEIRFIDTMAFMNCGLSTLVDNLKVSQIDMKALRAKFPEESKVEKDDVKFMNEKYMSFSGDDIKRLRDVMKKTSEHFPVDSDFLLMCAKGVYCYDYISSYDKLLESSLPSKEEFYSKLAKSEITDKDYKRAQIMWDHFKCETFLDYHNQYLIADVLLLTDVFQNFRDVSRSIYGLDPAYYYTAPGLSWDAFLKHKTGEYKREGKGIFYIELITDLDMYQMVESGIRGGLSQISKRHAVANNKYMTSHDKNLPDSYLLYLDANNLYGYSMCQYLPKGGFKWNTEEWTSQRIREQKDKQDIGYKFDVNIHIPSEHHDQMNGYPLACENGSIKKEYLNDWQKKEYRETKIEKLITTFEDKENYVVDYRLLKLFLELGAKITKINRVLEYKQEPFMESYIMKNTQMRAESKNEFEKDFFKLMNNSVYGKTMEAVRKRINFKILSSEEEAERLRNHRIRYTVFNENCVGVHLAKQTVLLNKPIIIGQTVLDQSKWLMIDFHYNTMLKNFNREDIDLMFTDTDSLCYHIKGSKDPFVFMKENSEQFDLANYKGKDVKVTINGEQVDMYDGINNKVVAKFKNESISQITEFIGLRSKLYAYITDDDIEHKKCKGVKSSVVKNEIKVENYRNTLLSKNNFKVEQNTFRSVKHQIYTITQSKIALSCNDDKLHILDNFIDTLSIGHYKTSYGQKLQEKYSKINYNFI